MKHTESYKILADSIRFLTVDAIDKANSGHPGMPLGMADIVSVLWIDFIHLDPQTPEWEHRDRFILSNGHGSMLQYAINYISGFAIGLDEIKQFRQLGSKTPGHPEYDLPCGIETTTGPLGQGVANAVGMAMGLKHKNIKSKVYCTVGDGCLMEGVSQEASSLAGTWALDNLVVLWDDNGISIDGQTDGWFTENVPLRYEALGWQVIRGVDGHDYQQIKQALAAAIDSTKPVLIQFKTVIGLGLELAGTAAVHGAPAGAEAITKMRMRHNWNYEPFHLPPEIEQIRNDIQTRWAKYRTDLFVDVSLSKPVCEFESLFLKAIENQKTMATRAASQWVIEQIAPQFEDLLIGSADLKESNLTDWPEAESFSADNYQGRYIHYGVREFGMFAIANGLALTGFRPVVATFLTFIDYGRNAVRLACMMKLPVIYVLTHDSIGLGEDGPTHQPIEHLAICRATPGLTTWRPASLLETTVAWAEAIEEGTPHALTLSRQKLSPVQHQESHIDGIKRGAYVVFETQKEVELVILSTGSELAMVYAHIHEIEAVVGSVRLVSVPSLERFLQQDQAYQEKLTGQAVRSMVVEAALSSPWHQVAPGAIMMTVESYGDSAPGPVMMQERGIDINHILNTLRQHMHIEEKLSENSN